MSNEYLNNKYLEEIIGKFQKEKKNKKNYETAINSPDEPLINVIVIDHEGNERSITLKECLEEYKKIEINYRELQTLLAESFFILADHIARYAKFNYVDHDDAVQEGVMICFDKIDRFNPEFGRSFNFFTTICFNSMRQMYRSSKNYNELKGKYQDHLQAKFEQTIMKNLRIKNFNRYKNNNSSHNAD